MFTHKVMLMFDHCMSNLDPSLEDEILLYHLIACMYIALKVESGFSGMEFAHFLNLCSQSPAYDALSKKLAPHLSACIWTPELLPILEREILVNGLKFKTQFVGC